MAVYAMKLVKIFPICQDMREIMVEYLFCYKAKKLLVIITEQTTDYAKKEICLYSN